MLCGIRFGFRLLAEYHSFLFLGEGELYKKFSKEFPSPYGVSFILIQLNLKNATSEIEMFPSPYGVSFILIKDIYITSLMIKFPSPCGVSFILIGRWKIMEI